MARRVIAKPKARRRAKPTRRLMSSRRAPKADGRTSGGGKSGDNSGYPRGTGGGSDERP